jgi:hypothetical protein
MPILLFANLGKNLKFAQAEIAAGHHLCNPSDLQYAIAALGLPASGSVTL